MKKTQRLELLVHFGSSQKNIRMKLIQPKNVTFELYDVLGKQQTISEIVVFNVITKCYYQIKNGSHFEMNSRFSNQITNYL